MNIEQLHQYCISKRGVTEHFPFDEDTLVFKVLGKMFALVPLGKWERGEASITLKCDPDYAEALRAEYSNIKGAYHMNKKHWNTLYLSEGEIPIQLLKSLIDHSYNLVVKGLPKKLQSTLL
ncbi:MmcQ/YjbR family DNA-binding protein [Flavobacteriaceae bacterium XHP0103]|uniref:MmcQ/YjbR family DNA-binding protein n=1 Tax=Marixanthotalea marina TaxID=2844359 RepID=UPI002989A8F5|nr:MmcQ/YjbR family DNA-binding protein [Marixanthotalea marina]MBU3821998.1 MmcQ/YjbR family DNA-binding protein [Marixanthotalea marina]